MKLFLHNHYKSLDIHTKEVIRKSVLPVFLKFSGVITGLLLSIFISRTVGITGVGIFNLSTQIGLIFVTLAMLGADQVIIKKVAIAQSNLSFFKISSILKSSLFNNGFLAVILSIIFVSFSSILSSRLFENNKLYIPFVIIGISFIPQVLSRVYSNVMIGIGQNSKGILSDQNLSGIFTLPITVFYYYFISNKLTVNNIIIFYLIGRIVVFIVQFIFWRDISKIYSQNTFTKRTFFVGSFSLFMISLLNPIMNNLEVFIFEFFGKYQEVGIFSILWRLSNLTILILLITNSALAPKMASLFNSGDLAGLQKMIQKLTKILSIFSLLTIIFFWFFGKYILSIWGIETDSAFTALIILSVGQSINLATGSNGLLLNMTGNEKIHFKILIVSFVFEIIIAYYLIGRYQIFGAAIACSLVNIVFNLLKNFYCRKFLNIKIF